MIAVALLLFKISQLEPLKIECSVSFPKSLSVGWDKCETTSLMEKCPFSTGNSTGEWEVLFNNGRSILIKRVNITVWSVVAGCSSQRRAWTYLFLYAGRGVELGQPRHFQTLLQVLLAFGAAGCPEQYGYIGGCLLFPCHVPQNVVGQSFAFALKSDWKKYLQITGILKWSIPALS